MNRTSKIIYNHYNPVNSLAINLLYKIQQFIKQGYHEKHCNNWGKWFYRY